MRAYYVPMGYLSSSIQVGFVFIKHRVPQSYGPWLFWRWDGWSQLPVFLGDIINCCWCLFPLGSCWFYHVISMMLLLLSSKLLRFFHFRMVCFLDFGNGWYVRKCHLHDSWYFMMTFPVFFCILLFVLLKICFVSRILDDIPKLYPWLIVVCIVGVAALIFTHTHK